MAMTMRPTTILQCEKRLMKSLALTVRFLQPSLGMKEPEILSRATAYLLSVDGKEKTDDGPHSHLKDAELRRKDRMYKQLRGRSAAAGQGREMMDLSWLEFVPREVRPNVHVVCSSHVLSPFLWRDYYPQPWLNEVRQEHCTYSLDVYNEESPKAVANYPLNPDPLHHPEGKDIALIHLQNEITALGEMKDLGVEILHLRSPQKLYQKGEDVQFDGFVINESGTVDEKKSEDDTSTSEEYSEESREFQLYADTGVLSFHTEDRFFATSPKPLPGGMCGAPVLDKDGSVCGTVEGIVPVDSKNTKLAGSAAFIPSFVMQAFIDFVERGLVEKMMPRDLFKMVETAKKTNSVGGGIFRKDKDGNYTVDTTFEAEYDKAIARLREKYSEDEYEEIMNHVTGQREEVISILDKDGGDVDDIIQRVQHKTLQIRDLVRDQVTKQ